MAAEWKETLETEREISAFMLELGIPAHLRGYYYLREAVLLAVSDMELVGSVTKLLYPVIARRYKTTLQRVERAIRNAVEVSWERGNPEVFEDCLLYTSCRRKSRKGKALPKCPDGYPGCRAVHIKSKDITA